VDSKDFEFDLDCTLGPSLLDNFDHAYGQYSDIIDDHDNPISDNEIQTLLELGIERISKDMNFQASFQGLKRRLQIHQQKLIKALRRLNERGLIEKTPEGYQLTPSGTKIALQLLRVPLQENQEKNECNQKPIMESTQVFYSANQLEGQDRTLTPETFLQNLKGKWFGKYRFVGQAFNADKAVVEFTFEDGEVHVCSCLNKKGILRLGIFKSEDRGGEEDTDLARDGKALCSFLTRSLNLHNSKFIDLEDPCFIDPISKIHSNPTPSLPNIPLDLKPKTDSQLHYS
jgi:DNA-binding MarR family transcriptional regulator